jgi:hypothetical protein
MLCRRWLGVVALLLCGAFPAVAQRSLLRVAVVPISAVSISKADAVTFAGLLEAALVKTGAFDVLEQNQTEIILQAQERSLSDCTDEKCAVEIGKLLAAEEIIIGTISSTGGRLYFLAKLIDVATGRNLRADSVDAPGLAELADAVDLLGYKLAGLTYRTEGTEQVATAFGEIYVETVPAGAQVLLNGVPKGSSPLLIEKVPAGRVSIEVRKDDLVARRDVDVVGDSLAKVTLELDRLVGNLLVRSPVTEGIRVFVDGKDTAALSVGIIEGVTAGDHDVVLQGGGYYWQGKATVQAGKSVTIQAYLREVGSLEYALPADAEGEIVGKDYQVTVGGQGKLDDVPVQTYAVHVTGKDWEPAAASVTVSRGQTARLAPSLQRTQQYRDREKYAALETQRTALERKLAAMTRTRRVLLAIGLPTLAVGVVGLGLGGVSYLLGTQAYETYGSAVYSADAVAARAKVQTFTTLLYVGIISGGSGVGVGGLLSIFAPSVRKTTQEIAALTAEMSKLGVR